MAGGEEDVELRDLIAHTLESRGVLGRIRAQLRASVFLALEEQESQQKPHPLENNKFQQYLKTKNGQIATALVREFLSFFELDYTCSVFDPETNALESCPGRSQLAQTLGLEDSTASGPLLDSMLQRATTTISVTTHHPPTNIVSLTTTSSRNPDTVPIGIRDSAPSFDAASVSDVDHLVEQVDIDSMRGDRVAGSLPESKEESVDLSLASKPSVDQDQVNGKDEDLDTSKKSPPLDDGPTSLSGSVKSSKESSKGSNKSSAGTGSLMPKLENPVDETEDHTLSEASLGGTSDYDYVESANS